MIPTLLQGLAVLALALFGTAFQARLIGTAPSLVPLTLGLAFGTLAAFAVAQGRLERLLRGRGTLVIGACTVLVLVALLIFLAWWLHLLLFL